MTTTTTPSTKPRTVADVVLRLLAQAQQDGEAHYEFRGVTYGAKVTTDERDRGSAELWKLNRCGGRAWTVSISPEGVIENIVAPDGEVVNPSTLSEDEWWTLCRSLAF